MKKNLIKDERIEIEKMKISSATFGILVIGLVIDVFYKLYINAQFNSYKGELIILFLSGGFYLCEATRKGVIELFPNDKEKKKFKVRYVLINTFLALTFAGVDIVQGSVKTYVDKLGLGLGVIAFIIVGYLIDVIIMKKSNKNV